MLGPSPRASFDEQALELGFQGIPFEAFSMKSKLEFIYLNMFGLSLSVSIPNRMIISVVVLLTLGNSLPNLIT